MDADGQITIEEAVVECERDRRLSERSDAGPIDLEEIGESFEFGWVILELLEKAGWYVHVMAPFAGQIDDQGTRGVMVVARHPFLDGIELSVTGRTVADCATPIMIEAGKYIRKIANARERAAAAA